MPGFCNNGFLFKLEIHLCPQKLLNQCIFLTTCQRACNTKIAPKAESLFIPPDPPKSMNCVFTWHGFQHSCILLSLISKKLMALVKPGLPSYQCNPQLLMSLMRRWEMEDYLHNCHLLWWKHRGNCFFQVSMKITSQTYNLNDSQSKLKVCPCSKAKIKMFIKEKLNR